MLIPPEVLSAKFSVWPAGVLHVGGHLAEESILYEAQGFGRVIWVEAQPKLAELIRAQREGSDDLVLTGAAWGESGIPMQLNITNNSQSSSLYDLAVHSEHYPSVVNVDQVEITTVRLDELVPADEKFDFLNLDIQGAELQALIGLGARLSDVNWIYCEVNAAQLYANIPMVNEIDDFLDRFGFVRLCTLWTKAQWGDALYCRSDSSLAFYWLRVRGILFSTAQSIRRHRRGFLRAVQHKMFDPLYRWLRRFQGAQ